MFRNRLPISLDLLLILLLILLALVAIASWYRSPDAEVSFQWSTESELDIVGFNLYRSDAPEGNYRQLNEHPIPAATDPLIGGNYHFLDKDVVPGTTYYYVLEIIDRSGRVSRREPVAITAE